MSARDAANRGVVVREVLWPVQAVMPDGTAEFEAWPASGGPLHVALSCRLTADPQGPPYRGPVDAAAAESTYFRPDRLLHDPALAHEGGQGSGVDVGSTTSPRRSAGSIWLRRPARGSRLHPG